MPTTNEAGTPDHLRQLFQSDEILWFDDGRWGQCGYAIPNGQGKTWTANMDIFHAHKVLGETLFYLAHREAVKFSQPPHKDFWWEWHKSLVSARNVIQAHRMDPGTTRNIKEGHVSNNRKTFLVFPVPYFGARVRQEDIRTQIELALILMGELMQHSANEKAMYVDGALVDVVVGYINDMIERVAVKYFGYTIDQIRVIDPATQKVIPFTIPAEKFNEQNYRPQDIVPNAEISYERPPMDWWPTENDLSAIRGIQYTDALTFAKRYPMNYLNGEGDWESTLPGIVNRVTSGDPGPTSAAATAGDRPVGEHAP